MITLTYDGYWPNSCSGNLIVTIDEMTYHLGNCLCSGGSVWFDEEWCEHVESGPWSINEWPDNFPKEYQQQVIDAVNLEIGWGCCGGCV